MVVKGLRRLSDAVQNSVYSDTHVCGKHTRVITRLLTCAHCGATKAHSIVNCLISVGHPVGTLLAPCSL